MPGLVIMDKAGEGWLVQFMEYVTKLPLVVTAPSEALTIGFSERTDQRVVVLATDLAALVAVSGIKGHSLVSLHFTNNNSGPGHRRGLGGVEQWTGAWRCHLRRACFRNWLTHFRLTEGSTIGPMGFNRRKMEDQRREAAEKEAAIRRASSRMIYIKDAGPESWWNSLSAVSK
jgi:hypothetical protein